MKKPLAKSAQHRAVFLDKDGTLVEDIPYNVDPMKISLTTGAARALPECHRLGYCLVVVSNQSGVARGYFPESALSAVEARLRELIVQCGAQLTGFYYCPHHPDGSVPEFSRSCDCRKPAPGMLQRAAADLNIDLAQSWLVGDILDDVEAGRRAGCHTILLDVGRETEWHVSEDRMPDYVAADLGEAARIIVVSEGAMSDELSPLASRESLFITPQVTP